MKKRSLISAGILLFSLFANSARADNITQLVIEKLVNADRKTGYILSSDVEQLKNMKMRLGTVYASTPKVITPSTIKDGLRTYSIVTGKDVYDSLISVKDSGGNEIKRISIGRQAIKIIKSNKTKHLFVLCGGYFGSVWEIDPKLNQVVRKYSTSWNPTDLTLDSDEKFLYVTSGKIQRFSTDNDVTFEMETPSEVRYFYSANVLDNSTMIFGAINREGNQVSYTITNSSSKPVLAFSPAVYVPSIQQSVNSEVVSLPVNSDIVMLYSRSNDFLYLFSLSKGQNIGVVPLDAKIDEVMILPKLNKALVLHRLIGQISVIDLKANTDTQYSVFARIIDERLKDATNTMVYEDNKVFIKSDVSQEGYIDTDNILRYRSPVVEIPFNKEKERVVYSTLAGKRYYLRNSQLFYEDLNDPNLAQAPNRKIKLAGLGNNIGGIELNPNKKVLYFSDSAKNMVYTLDAFTNKVTGQFMVGSEPAEIVMEKNQLYVLNRGDQTMSTVDLSTGETVKLSRLKIENNNLNVIKLYDKDFDQIVKITLAPDLDNKELTMVKAENQD